MQKGSLRMRSQTSTLWIESTVPIGDQEVGTCPPLNRTSAGAAQPSHAAPSRNHDRTPVSARYDGVDPASTLVLMLVAMCAMFAGTVGALRHLRGRRDAWIASVLLACAGVIGTFVAVQAVSRSGIH